MEGFGRILALSADHPHAVDYIVLIGDSQVSQKRLNAFSWLPGPKKCKKMVTNGCKRKPAQPLIRQGRQRRSGTDSYSTTSFSMMTFTCAVTSLCSFTGTSNSPTAFRGSCN